MKLLKSASIDLTYKCNFRCKHCYNTSGEHMNKPPELTDKEVLRIAEELVETNVESVCLCGGEALLRKDLLFETCQYLKEKNILVSTVSNGYLLNEEVADQLKNCGIDTVQISVDGASSETHDWMRNQKGSYEKAINALKILHQKGIKTESAFVPTKKNISELEMAIDNAYELGAEAFRIQPIMKLGRAKKFLEDYFLDNKEYMACKMLIDKKRAQYINNNFTIEWADPLEHLRFYSSVKNVLNHISITAYGDIMITPYLSVSFGNIRRNSIKAYVEGGLKEAWNNPLIKSMIENLHSAEDMDVSLLGLPEIFIEDNIDLDILRDDYQTKTAEIIRTWRDKNWKKK